MQTYAQIVVNRPIVIHRQGDDSPNPYLTAFHYHIPSELQSDLKIGHLVAVPFRTQVLQGIVIAYDDSSPVEKTKPIHGILDPQPVLTSCQLQLVKWLAGEYFTPLATFIRYFLPPGTSRQPTTIVEVIPNIPIPDDLSPTEFVLLTYLQSQKKSVLIADLEKSVVDSLVEKGLIQTQTRLAKPHVGPRFDRTLKLTIFPDEIEDALLHLGRSSKQVDVLLYLMNHDESTPTVKSVCESVGCTQSTIRTLRKKGWIDILRDKKPYRIILRLPHEKVPSTIIDLRNINRHEEVLNLLAWEDEAVWLGWVYAQTSANLKTIKDLTNANLIIVDEERVWRDPLAGKTFTLSKPPILSSKQIDILKEIIPSLKTTDVSERKPFLVHGVTGSGKTEIYLRAIEIILEQKRQAIFLVPEILLATHIVERVQARFPGKVALWHSALSMGERFDTWDKVRQGDLPIVVGPRSALFAPLPNLGLIIIDEEHDPAYKQHNKSPLFHAREAAVELARIANITLIMGSATPDIVSYRKAKRGIYHLLKMPNRILAHKEHIDSLKRELGKSSPGILTAQRLGPNIFSLPMPPVEIVDLRTELKAGNRSIFSRALAKAIQETLARKEQIILFLNRRGTATFVNCRDCGHAMHCPDCETTLTYHAPNQELICHQCGYHVRNPDTCPMCLSKRIRYFGLGTERVEQYLLKEFPHARPLRFDQDTVRLHGHYNLLEEFESGKANVMIGTQMVAKGLDLPLVTLVGVISADTALYLPDFRAGERTFQILTQVAGRAGRSPLGGRVIIQSYSPEQIPITAAAKHDYETFYQSELDFRYQNAYPPFKQIALMYYVGRGQERAKIEAHRFANELRLWIDQQGFPAVDVIGPAPSYIKRIRSKYRWQIIMRARNPAQVLERLPLPVGWRVDIDPVNIL